MADKEQQDNKSQKIEADKNNKKKGKERAINPMAMRPEGIEVSIQMDKKTIEAMKKLYGF